MKKMETEPLSDAELLELLLFYVFKRRNTNDLAHRLISEFGGIRQLFKADMKRLRQVEGIGPQTAAFIYALACCNRALLRPVKKTDLTIWDRYDAEAFIRYIEDDYRGLKTEVLNFYLINADGRISMRRSFEGTEEAVAINPSEFTQIIMENEPSGVIAVHNHPQGVATPSTDDDEMTKICQLMCSFHNVLFCDHIIVADDGCYSYYKAGKMKELFDRYAIHNYKGEGETNKDLSYGEADFSAAFRKDLNKIEFELRDGKYVGVIKD